jgi:hypothetical protein
MSASNQAFGQRFAAQHPEVIRKEIEKDLFRTAVFKIDIERVTGKARR